MITLKMIMEVVGVSRTGNPEYKGDLTDIEFRKKIIRGNPDVFVNNGSILDHNFMNVIETNLVASGHLLTEFYKKMKDGIIINMSSSCVFMHRNA